MALWIINRPDKHANRTEVRVAQCLKRLNDRWTICWGYYYTDNQGINREGDFLVLGPYGGLLVLEVKAGNIRPFAFTGNWETDLEDQQDHPLFQLDQEWNAVIRRLKQTKPCKVPWVARALCQPDEFIHPDEKAWQGIPREFIFSAEDLADFSKAWKRSFKNPEWKVNQEQKDTFINAYGENSRPEKIREFIDHTEEIFRQQLTANYSLLDLVRGNRQLLVQGGCGSGKTWLALDQAAHLAEQGEGQHVLLLCYNEPLSHLLNRLVEKRAIPRGRITVLCWEALAEHILRECDIPNQAPDEETADKDTIRRYYDEELPGILQECITDPKLKERLPQFDALVVDEAQDHDSALPDALGAVEPSGDQTDCGWWNVYFALLRKGLEAPMALFYDPAQRPLFRPDRFNPHQIAGVLSQPAFVSLPAGQRYTRPVLEFLQNLDAQGTVELVAGLQDVGIRPEGPPVEIYSAGDMSKSTPELVEHILQDWQQKGYCDPQEVLLLYVRSELAKSPLSGVDSLLDYGLVEAAQGKIDPEMKNIRHTNVHRAKGLDATGVILVGLKPFEELTEPSYRQTYFMAASRAKQLLAVVHE